MTTMATLASVSALSTFMATLASVSALSTKQNGNSDLCVSIVNIKTMAILASVSALPMQQQWQLCPLCQHCQYNNNGNSGLCASIVDKTKMATLASVPVLLTKQKWQLWPLCQHYQLNLPYKTRVCQHCQHTKLAPVAFVLTLSTQHCQPSIVSLTYLVIILDHFKNFM